MKSRVKKVMDEYSKAVHVDIRKKRRQVYVVQPRAALMVAMSKEMPVVEVARAFDMNHATVLHHKRKHLGNLDHWVGYKDKYEIARAMCDAWLRRERIERAINRVNNKIESLQDVAKKLNQRLNNEQLQIQDD
tara:strand:+ start:1000 stop:1398 length:399 start_codon:yes stop_codon:yes gene_type:complete